jgi:hypothetical protein
MSRRIVPEEDWPIIWERYKSGENSTDIAKDYGCHSSAICAGLRRNGHTLRPQRVSLLRGRVPLTKTEQDARHYQKHGEKIRGKLRVKYAENPDFYRAKAKNFVAKPPPNGITQKRCNGCQEERAFSEFSKKKAGKYGLRARCKRCEALDAHSFRKSNPEKARATLRKWRENTPVERRRDIRNRSNAKRMKNPTVKLASTLRKQLSEILKRKGIQKRADLSALELVGCTVQNLKSHLEGQFQEGMNWGNYGVQRAGGQPMWHIDHIVEVYRFDLKKDEDIKRCFHYSNLRPMWAIENIRRSRKSVRDKLGKAT